MPMHIAPHKLVFIALLCLLSLSACRDAGSMPGNVLSVNGEGVSYHEAEARRIARFAVASPAGDLGSDSELLAQYRYVVNQLIEELVICQYMEQNGMPLEPDALRMEEQRLRNDYPDNTFEQSLLEAGVDLEEWRKSLYRQLMIKHFLTQVIRPEISITADEVQQYFKEHSADFRVPEQWHFIQISGPDQKTVEAARTSFMKSKNAGLVRKNHLVSIHDIRIGKDRLPAELEKLLSPLKPWTSSPVKKFEDELSTFILIDKTPATMLETAEMANRVEQALAEEKMRKVYAAWVEQRIAQSDIRLAPALLERKTPAEEGQKPASRQMNATEPLRQTNGTKAVPRQANGTAPQGQAEVTRKAASSSEASAATAETALPMENKNRKTVP